MTLFYCRFSKGDRLSINNIPTAIAQLGGDRIFKRAIAISFGCVLR
ncbi:MAG: hypothetical protein SW833_05930 [Cyanobacteriota bacterium]|nr:hypothetical protein [Cyanobacteriota bacterium]